MVPWLLSTSPSAGYVAPSSAHPGEQHALNRCLLSADELVCHISHCYGFSTLPHQCLLNKGLQDIALASGFDCHPESTDIPGKDVLKWHHTHEELGRTSLSLLWVPSRTYRFSASESSASAHIHVSHRAQTQPLEAPDLSHAPPSFFPSHSMSTDLLNLRPVRRGA